MRRLGHDLVSVAPDTVVRVSCCTTELAPSNRAQRARRLGLYRRGIKRYSVLLMSTRRAQPPSATAALLQSLDVILFEVTNMEKVVRDADSLADPDRHALRHRISRMFSEADELMNWLTAQRLEQPAN